MISKRLEEALMQQVNDEMWSANLYLSMSYDAAHKGYKGIAHWFREQYKEELEHCFKIVSYLQQNFVKVELRAVAEVTTTWDKPLNMFQDALVQEKQISTNFHKFYEMSLDDKDYATNIFLQWFVTEQVQEEEQVQEIIDELNLISEDKVAMLMFDKKLRERV